MRLDQELGFRKGFTSRAHEAVLSIYCTSAGIKKRATRFFAEHGLTDVQFNLLMLLAYQGDEQGGLTQVELSRMMFVNRANITTLIDRMENAGLVRRDPLPGDRRYNLVRLTSLGGEKLTAAEGDYRREIERITGAHDAKRLTELVDTLSEIRATLAD